MRAGVHACVPVCMRVCDGLCVCVCVREISPTWGALKGEGGSFRE